MRQHILIISPYYPPVRSIATQRIYSFVKYLSYHDINVHVITLKQNEQCHDNLQNVFVYRLNNKVFLPKCSFNNKENLFVHYVKAAYNTIYSQIWSNEYSGWTNEAIKMAIKLHQIHKLDAIITSFSPLASHLVGLKIKRMYGTEIKWIADMRDEMSTNPYLKKVARWRLKKSEKLILSYADAITSVSKPILDDFRRKNNNKSLIFKEICNGFDFDVNPVSRNSYSDSFHILYTGSFYGLRSPDNFFKALSNLINKRNFNIKVTVLGNKKPLWIPQNIQDKVFQEDEVTYEASIEWMKCANALLLIIPTFRGEGCYTGKIFDYLGSLKPIIGLIPPNGVAAELLCEAENGKYIVPNENISQIEETILKAFKDWKQGNITKPNQNVIKKYHRSEQAEILYSLICELLERGT